MKKILVVSVMAFGLVMLSPSAHAIIPMGIEVGVGLEHSSREFEDPDPAKPAIDATVLGLWIEPTMEVMEGLDVYLMLGMASIEAEQAGEVPIDGSMDLGWGLGVRYIMPMDGIGLPGLGLIEGMPFGEALEIGFGFEWINLSSDFDVVGTRPAGTVDISGWSLSVFASEDMGMFVPYLGLRYSDMTAEVTIPGEVIPDYDAADNFGIFLGADIPMDFANINLEIGFLDATSFRVGASLAF